jgi:hypothetical protein
MIALQTVVSKSDEKMLKRRKKGSSDDTDDVCVVYSKFPRCGYEQVTRPLFLESSEGNAFKT